MFETQIRTLAARADSKGPFLSLYIDTFRADESQRDRVRLFVKNELHKIKESIGGNGQQEPIDRALKSIEGYIEQVRPDSRGVALFACPGDGFFEAVELPVPVRPEVSIGSRPNLRQLTELRQRYPRVVLCIVDAKSARLFELEFGTILNELDLENPALPRKHDQGSWSQANLQRHVQDHIDRHHKEVAELLARLVDQHRVPAVILSGQERSIANFREFLPKRIDEKVIGTLHLDGKSSSGDDMASACAGLVAANRGATLAVRLDALFLNGKGALGCEKTIDAFNQRRVDTLFIAPRAEGKAWKCSSCAVMGLHVPLGCPSCGADVMTVNLVDELVSAAALEDAHVEYLPEATLVDRHEGVAALLRF
ncbi:MAG TPA: Vms1/Ankzf1 family peptidyl-tRNA hydrolase [Thermoanaerobaculia bacterium]|nr:Vms1/Ankzf1 family peptidyl-tRNA hydrolase [Thermoanaerobaculia bacterium]